MSDSKEADIQRGKRKAAIRFELLAVVLVGLAVFEVGGINEVFAITFTSCLAYSAALRGLDAKWPSKRM